ncbi:XRE family transcriptional regulator [Achromobacter xylosoxidans]|uniref:XRE family transcriptional regulator n=1 Tax=Alcaligenes xylosoxydans xylosoxydans TaxID=85698 RepID=UPI00047AC5F0|nr:LexA family transcriptional regulator [Achromobacter xylosoxidans]QQE59187.1 LexA family transcriptional regulator [Achromobacter xylosoxidans]QQV12931.1 LexA family transcriptional regulator [Achromobacter xylosoxidans]
MQTFSDRVRARRIELGLSQVELAKKAGLSQSTVAQIERGRNSRSAHILNLAEALKVHPRWLEGGEGPKDENQSEGGEADALVRPQAWPFPDISEDEVRALAPAQLNALQGAIALAIAQLKLGIKVAPRTTTPKPAPQRGALVDMDAAEDAFPMRVGGAPLPPWNGGKTTFQAEREAKLHVGTLSGLIANVGPGDPHAANDRFEKVPELGDVRLAAGDGIENHIEEQTGVVHFRRSFLRSVGADNGRGRVVYAKGDSMEPDIKDGWALLVVPSDTLTPPDLVPGAIYAINYDGKMLVKMVARDDLTGRWVARSKNSRYQDVPLQGDGSVRILGRVVWAGGLLPVVDQGRRTPT